MTLQDFSYDFSNIIKEKLPLHDYPAIYTFETIPPKYITVLKEK